MREIDRRRGVPLALCLAAVLAGPAASANVTDVPPPFPDTATEDLPYSRSGGYMGVGGAFVLQNFSANGTYSDSGSVVIRAGFRGTPYLGVEFLGEVLPDVDDRSARDADVSAFAVSVNAKLLAPLGRAEPYLMAGLGILDIDRDGGDNRRDDFVFRSAAGVDIYLTPRWALYGEVAYMLPSGEVDRFDYATFGAGFFFRF